MRRAAKPPRPSDTPPMLGGAEAALPLGVSDLPVSLLIGGRGGGIPPLRREGRCSPTRAKRGARPNVSSNSFYLQLAIISETNHNAINEA